jgi:hypothetical protein
MASTGKPSGLGKPPAKEMTSGRAANFKRSRMTELAGLEANVDHRGAGPLQLHDITNSFHTNGFVHMKEIFVQTHFDCISQSA